MHPFKNNCSYTDVLGTQMNYVMLSTTEDNWNKVSEKQTNYRSTGVLKSVCYDQHVTILLRNKWKYYSNTVLDFLKINK